MKQRIARVLLADFLSSLVPALMWQGPPQVKTHSGNVEGKEVGKVQVFLGIPYAAPPVGDLRWKPPAPVAKWSGVNKATDFGVPLPARQRIYGDMNFRDPGGSEDCLTLNVWTPANPSSKKLPVMVWIYGGGFVAGTTSEARQDGTYLAQQGVIVVSMNYRLGVFGFLVHPELAKESGHNSAGNYGLLDQLAALAVGPRQHRRIRWRSRQRHHLRRKRRIIFCQRADGLASGQGSFPEGDRRKWCSVSSAAVCRSRRCRSGRERFEVRPRKARRVELGRAARDSRGETARSLWQAGT